MASPAWEDFELTHAIQSKRTLEFVVQGMTGQVVGIRPTDDGIKWVIVKTAFPGTAYLQASQILTRPPSSIGAGRRVKTAFGPARVRSLRRNRPRLDYEVELTHAPLANGKYAVAYLGIDDVIPLSFGEILADSETAKNRGNALLKAKEWRGAIAAYEATVSVMREALSLRLSLLERRQMLDVVVKAMSNKTQALLSLPEPDFRGALEASDEALMIDDLCDHTMREKIMSRRGTALLGLKQYEDAVAVFRDASLTDNQDAQLKLQRALAEIRRAREREAEVARAMFSGKKAGGTPKGSSSPAGAASPTAATAAASSPSKNNGAEVKAPPPRSGRVAAAASSASSAAGAVIADKLRANESADQAAASSSTGGSDWGWGTTLVAGVAFGALAIGAAAVAMRYFGRQGGSAQGGGAVAAAGRLGSAAATSAAGAASSVLAAGKKLK